MKIPFGLDENGRIVDIRDVPPSVEGNFRCAECKQPVTRKQGDDRVGHFAHKAESTCGKAFETALHLLAKQILVESDVLRAPALVCQFDARPSDEDIALFAEQTLHWNSAGETEVWVDGIRPDFRGVWQGKAIFVEVTVTHEPGKPKLEALKRLQTPTLEIDLSAARRDITVEEIRQRVLDATGGKRWVFYPGEAEVRARLEALRDQREAEEYDELERQQQDERRREAAQRAARTDAGIERLRKIEKANASFRAGTTAQQLAFLEGRLGKFVSDWPAILGHSVRGASSVKVSTLVWQADVFRRHILGQGARHPKRSVTVESVADWLVQRYDIASNDWTSVRVAVWDFLSALERADYLRRRVRQEFEILRDVLGDETEVPPQRPQPRPLRPPRGVLLGGRRRRCIPVLVRCAQDRRSYRTRRGDDAPELVARRKTPPVGCCGLRPKPRVDVAHLCREGC
ncbi:Competence protein CoiA-like family protein [Caballeronia calidae]|uniref:Competence protein CoiA-like family protein n=1 Tax=Caballeronia calidae TaxID=1777139 RepID=A0A158ELE0_9BURK|nr:competence protein CoiA family protein [Caballeronia calidae]SAL06737.1 Competence protein CoiA-like family protein [Caballeronia calidae]